MLVGSTPFIYIALDIQVALTHIHTQRFDFKTVHTYFVLLSYFTFRLSLFTIKFQVAKITKPSDYGFTAKYCFDGLYIIQLLKMYGFTTDELWKTLTFDSKVR